MAVKSKSKRRVMRAFKISEISAVDKPAQEGATATLMKRNTAQAEPIEVMIIKRFLDEGEFKTNTIEKSITPAAAHGLDAGFKALNDSLHSIATDGTLSDVYKLEMMKSSAGEFLEYAKQKVPNIEKYLQDSLSEGQEDMNLRQLQKQMNVLNAKLDTIVKMATVGKQGPYTAAPSGGAGADDAAAERLRAMMSGGGAATEKAEDEEDSMYEMEETEKADETEPGQVTTEGEEEDVISAGSQDAIGEGEGGAEGGVATGDSVAGGTNTPEKTIGKRSDRVRLLDDSIDINGKVFSKRQVGDDLFTVLKSQQDRIDNLAKSVTEERDLRELFEFAKVAEGNLKHLPGTVEQKAGLLRSLNKSLNGDERALISKMLQAGDKSMRVAFETVGTRGDDVKKAAGNFAKRVSDIKTRDNCTNTEAMQKARKEFPDEYEAYQGN